MPPSHLSASVTANGLICESWDLAEWSFTDGCCCSAAVVNRLLMAGPASGSKWHRRRHTHYIGFPAGLRLAGIDHSLPALDSVGSFRPRWPMQPAVVCHPSKGISESRRPMAKRIIGGRHYGCNSSSMHYCYLVAFQRQARPWDWMLSLVYFWKLDFH